MSKCRFDASRGIVSTEQVVWKCNYLTRIRFEYGFKEERECRKILGTAGFKV